MSYTVSATAKTHDVNLQRRHSSMGSQTNLKSLSVKDEADVRQFPLERRHITSQSQLQPNGVPKTVTEYVPCRKKSNLANLHDSIHSVYAPIADANSGMSKRHLRASPAGLKLMAESPPPREFRPKTTVVNAPPFALSDPSPSARARPAPQVRQLFAAKKVAPDGKGRNVESVPQAEKTRAHVNINVETEQPAGHMGRRHIATREDHKGILKFTPRVVNPVKSEPIARKSNILAWSPRPGTAPVAGKRVRIMDSGTHTAPYDTTFERSPFAPGSARGMRPRVLLNAKPAKAKPAPPPPPVQVVSRRKYDPNAGSFSLGWHKDPQA